jgi:CRISPR-associated exonuclease Cas4
MTYAEDDYLMISGLQHFVFCRRQWALIHVECLWEENRLTAEGEILHKNAHNEGLITKRPGILITRGMRVSSPYLGVTGQCDVVEFIRSEEGAVLHGHRGTWQVCPVEYKHGKDKQDESDVLQLCCEAMCLEEMLSCRIPYGYLYYHEIRHRRKIDLTQEIRQHVQDMTAEMHHYMKRGYTPKVKTGSYCNACSVKNLCIPRLCRNPSVSGYYKRMMEGGDDETSS